MDCVTYLLVAMCMLYGQNVEAANADRPMGTKITEGGAGKRYYTEFDPHYFVVDTNRLKPVGQQVIEAENAGRPMTWAEVDRALEAARRHLKSNVGYNSNFFSARIGLDPYTHSGLGKRYDTEVDPYSFVVALAEANPGRPITWAEVDRALEAAIRRLKADDLSNFNAFLARGGLDPYAFAGTVGKRYDTEVDPYKVVPVVDAPEFL